jgi:hypothetical protein
VFGHEVSSCRIMPIKRFGYMEVIGRAERCQAKQG